MTSTVPPTLTPTPGPNSDTGWSVGIWVTAVLAVVVVLAIVLSFFRTRDGRRTPKGGRAA